ncbi:DUF1800 domain-containing protein [Hydrogenophaga sp.]|uniref:DUF1800 domain-containing protein n=1 Tax=Hydrogenophaga sp. TaxID=1904254 RepID=UPI003F7042D0
MTLEAAIASHRFGLSEPRLDRVVPEPRQWVMDQLRRPQAMETGALTDGAAAWRLTAQSLRQALSPASGQEDAREARARLVAANQQALKQRWQHQVSTTTPVHERWVLFWANHFTVAATKGTTLGLVWPFENEAIRPHATGRFATLLRAATLHPGMLLYLDNAQSVGPASRQGRRRERGLNENLARELLELHTVGVQGGYTQADVTELARLLTGWTVNRREGGNAVFQPNLHEPGTKRVMGREYPEGPEALDALWTDLARHPATARHLATRLVRHFVADDPPDALVQAVARSFQRSDGDLLQTAAALFDHELAWQVHAPGKARRPEELLVAAHRVLGQSPEAPARWVARLTAMGQPPGLAPSPQGWPERQEDWLGPDALHKRVDWALDVGRAQGSGVDARVLARQAWGVAMSERTLNQIDRADSGAQALALLMASPEMQRR